MAKSKPIVLSLFILLVAGCGTELDLETSPIERWDVKAEFNLSNWDQKGGDINTEYFLPSRGDVDARENKVNMNLATKHEGMLFYFTDPEYGKTYALSETTQSVESPKIKISFDPNMKDDFDIICGGIIDCYIAVEGEVKLTGPKPISVEIDGLKMKRTFVADGRQQESFVWLDGKATWTKQSD